MARRLIRHRSAFTLIELLIAIGIIVLILALGAMFLPLIDRDKGVANQTTRIEGYIRLSKAQALRDGAPRGIRLVQDPNNPTQCNAIQYIEQPEPIAPRGPGVFVMITTPNPIAPLPPPYPNPMPAQVMLMKPNPSTGAPEPTNWDDPLNPQIGVSDFLELNLSPHVVARITQITGIPQAPRCILVLDRSIEGTDTGTPMSLFDGFRVIRAPRPLVGEPLVQLHKDVYIDLTWCYPCPGQLNHPVTGLPVPNGSPPYGNNFTYFQPWSPTGPLDILFNASGNVANAPTGQLILCVQHRERPDDKLLVVVYTRTGKVSAVNVYDVGGQDPYFLARDGRGSGL